MRTISTAEQLPAGAVIAIYGSGGRGRELLEAVRALPEKNITVRCFVDSFAGGEAHGLPKYSLEEFLRQDAGGRGEIVVASEASTQIVWTLRERGAQAAYLYDRDHAVGVALPKAAPGAMAGFLQKYFPRNTVPATGAAGRPGYTELGYTSPDVGRRGDLNVMFLGCSWTADAGVERSFTGGVCQRFARSLGASVMNWNLALGGESVDNMVRTLMCSVDALRPDLVFLVFTGLDRAEYYTMEGERVRFQLDWLLEREKGTAAWRGLPRPLREAMSALGELYSPYEDVARFLKNYQLIEHTLDSRAIPWGFSMVPAPRVIEPIEDLMRAGWISPQRYLGEPFEVQDYVSREDPHPGPESRERFADKVHDWFMRRHGDDIRYIVSRRKG